MLCKKLLAVPFVLATLSAPYVTFAEGDMAVAEAHVNLASAIAGDSYKRALGNCSNLGSEYVIPKADLHPLLEKMIGLDDIDPFQAFDNLYFVGAQWTSTWAITTSDGIILIGAQNNGDQVQRVVESGLKKMGLNPADIKKVIVEHSHGDHYGGAKYLQDKYGADIIMSQQAWDRLELDPLQYDDEIWDPLPKRDVSVNDGDVVSLGDTSITIISTPGHTDDTISMIIPLTDKGKMHKAILWGGNEFNAGRKPHLFVDYIKSTDRVREMAFGGIDVFLSNHGGLDGTLEYVKNWNDRKGDDSNPYVIGQDGVQRIMATFRQCALASLSSFSVESAINLP